MVETRYIEGQERYALSEMIGRGGFATVWRARSLEHGDEVAVKIIPVYSAAERSRALREGRIAEGLEHRNIVETLEVIPGDLEVYLVTEYIRGVPLDEAARTYSIEEVSGALSQVLEALAYAHGQGVIHRDIKPQNALVDVRGAVKLTDFGVAFRTGDTRLTKVGFAVGTPGYIAPEIISGEDPTELSDIYAVGATARTLLAEQPEEPPPRLADFVNRATAPNPDHRPRSAKAALRLLNGSRTLTAPAQRPPSRRRNQERKKPAALYSEHALRVVNGVAAGWLGYLGAGLMLNGAGMVGVAVGLGVLGYLLPRLAALGVIVALAVALARSGVGLGITALAPALGGLWLVFSGAVSGSVGRLPLGPTLAVPLAAVGLGAGLPMLFGVLMRPLGAALSAAGGAVALVGYDLTFGDGAVRYLGLDPGGLSLLLSPLELLQKATALAGAYPALALQAALWAAMAGAVAVAERLGRPLVGAAAAVGGGVLGYALLVSRTPEALSEAMTSLALAAIIYGAVRYLVLRVHG